MTGTASPRLTILIPLHRGREWIENLSYNLRCCPSDSRVLVSDATLEDNAIDLLEERHRGDSRLQFFRRKSDIGWRRHTNELLNRVETEFSSILPQDDAIHRGYYEHLMDALDANRSAGLAFGVIEAHYPGSQLTQQLPRVPFPLGQAPPHEEAIQLDRTWNLGIPWRGVVRRELLWPTPLIPHGFADQIWTFGIALRSHLVEIPEAIYLKRYHPNNTHSAWEPLVGLQRERILRETIEHRLADSSSCKQSALEILLNTERVD